MLLYADNQFKWHATMLSRNGVSLAALKAMSDALMTATRHKSRSTGTGSS